MLLRAGLYDFPVEAQPGPAELRRLRHGLRQRLLRGWGVCAMRSLLAAVSLVAFSGCFLRHSPSDDEPPDDVDRMDAGTGDGEVSRPDGATWGDGCPYAGIYPVCDTLCDGTNDCPGEDGDYTCHGFADLCVPRERRDTEERCSYDFGPPTRFGSACPLALDACTLGTDSPSPDNLENREGFVSGGCWDISMCLAPEELHPNLKCYYSDMTEVETGPPMEACPAEVDGDFPFCGTECGDCPMDRERYLGCVGLNDDHGVGVCVLNFGCRPMDGTLDPEFWETLSLPDLACLVLRDPATDEWIEGGWLTGEVGCKAYRAINRDRFDCRDYDWNSIPD